MYSQTSTTVPPQQPMLSTRFTNVRTLFYVNVASRSCPASFLFPLFNNALLFIGVVTDYSKTVVRKTFTEKPRKVDSQNVGPPKLWGCNWLKSLNNINPAMSITSVTLLLHLPSCLLYTSPSPRDRQKSRMPSSA